MQLGNLLNAKKKIGQLKVIYTILFLFVFSVVIIVFNFRKCLLADPHCKRNIVFVIVLVKCYFISAKLISQGYGFLHFFFFKGNLITLEPKYMTDMFRVRMKLANEREILRIYRVKICLNDVSHYANVF